MPYISAQLRQRIEQQAKNRCGYCLSPQHLVMAKLEIDHIIPTSKGGTDDEENLWLACSFCNVNKSDHINGIDPISGEIVTLFNPRTQKWDEHFRWSDDGTNIEGFTAIGRVTVKTLDLNGMIQMIVRANWVSAGWHPPKD